MTVHTPIETRSGGIPPWALVLAVLVLLVGAAYVVSNLAGENPPIALPGHQTPPPGGGEPDPAVGEALVAQAQPACTSCHGADLTGGVGPSLQDVENGPVSENLQDLAAEHPEDWISIWIAGEPGGPADGIDRMGMPAYHEQFSPEQIKSLEAYLLSLP